MLEAFARVVAYTDARHPTEFLFALQGSARCGTEPELFKLLNDTARTAWIEAKGDGISAIDTISFWSDSQGRMLLKFKSSVPDGTPEIALHFVPDGLLLFIEGDSEKIKGYARTAGARLRWRVVTDVTVSRPEPVDALTF